VPSDQDQPPPDDRAAPPPASIVDALRTGVLDPELAGLLWLLLEGGVSCVVAGAGEGAGDRARRAGLLEAVLDLVPGARVRIPLAGPSEDLAWLEDAESLGWRRTVPADPVPADPSTTLLLAGELGGLEPTDPTGDTVRLAIRALGRGYSVAATVQGARLEEVLEGLRRRPIHATDDELARLGVVLVLAPGPADRVGAAHYLRPLARDVHGHPQRLPPAVLATWDEGAARFEHFAWGLATELAARVALKVGDFELERERRSVGLAALAAMDPMAGAAAGRVDGRPAAERAATREALERMRLGAPGAPTGHRH
jgi:hypothetical protein